MMIMVMMMMIVFVIDVDDAHFLAFVKNSI